MVSKNACKLFVRSAAIAFLLFTSTFQMFGTPRNGEPIDTSVCEIVAKPNKFNKKAVQLRGFVKSDMIEHTVLLDSTCESQGISLWVTAKLRARSEIRGQTGRFLSSWEWAQP
jgi:hypothetical protein